MPEQEDMFIEEDIYEWYLPKLDSGLLKHLKEIAK